MNKYKVSNKSYIESIQEIMPTMNNAQLDLLWRFLVHLVGGYCE